MSTTQDEEMLARLDARARQMGLGTAEIEEMVQQIRRMPKLLWSAKQRVWMRLAKHPNASLPVIRGYLLEFDHTHTDSGALIDAHPEVGTDPVCVSLLIKVAHNAPVAWIPLTGALRGPQLDQWLSWMLGGPETMRFVEFLL
jgi:hypothetical protein